MESNAASTASEQLICESCSKSYQRRDLLMRHRRRCRGLAKGGTRRKACDACVRAKSKCCYTHPTCSRCIKRGTRCLYSAQPAVQSWAYPEHVKEASSVQIQGLQSHSSTGSQSPAHDFPTWGFPLSPYPLDTLDFNTADFTDVSPVSHLESLIERSYIPPTTHANPPSTSLEQSSNGGTRFPSGPPISSAPLILTRVLGDYASSLIKYSCFAPFLHLPKVKNVEPDLASFPFTSMAICSSTGMNLSTDKQFFRRAIEAARHGLIGNFPSYECMQQWDAIHALLIYEALELKEGISIESEGWRLAMPVKNLEMSFLLKMTRSYIEPYLQIRSCDMDAFSDRKSSPCSPQTTTWGRWRTTETTRRTVFIVNMVNFLNSYNPTTRSTSPYYEPLNDDLILNMPLPCSQTVWLAYEEESCRLAMKNQPFVNHSSPEPDQSTMEALSRETCLSTILSKYTKESIQAAIGSHVGVGDSDSLRRLIILCATEQFL
ncbi:hypothetical protein CCMA1212_005332 [Trichoderma ghanense]|uniref:Zn(2)-C6 fungal-type domain-containing protein n=1 Tax=Trichoderma ghanense TaxID=65468 RepID=A0ABY2H462_9HYPO